jgi:hypothetical protein
MHCIGELIEAMALVQLQVGRENAVTGALPRHHTVRPMATMRSTSSSRSTGP